MVTKHNTKCDLGGDDSGESKRHSVNRMPSMKRSMNNALTSLFLFSKMSFLFTTKTSPGYQICGEGRVLEAPAGDDIVTDGEGGRVNQWIVEQVMILRVKHTLCMHTQKPELCSNHKLYHCPASVPLHKSPREL